MGIKINPDDQVYEWDCFFVCFCFPKTRYMNGVGFAILARTHVPQLHPSYSPSPHTEKDLI